MTNGLFNSGIYGIFTSTGIPLFVGSSKVLDAAFNEVDTALKNDAHLNRKLQDFFNETGGEDFLFMYLMQCHKSDLMYNTQRFIKLLNPVTQMKDGKILKAQNFKSKPLVDAILQRFKNQYVSFIEVSEFLKEKKINASPGFVGRALKPWRHRRDWSKPSGPMMYDFTKVFKNPEIEENF